jgi:catechol 2,3-dioxygenase-like lactoylglutathione lyase family enzyme
MLRVIQLGLVTLDLPATLRLYSEAFGFRNAGGQCIWASEMLGLGPDARNLLWWLVGGQGFFQLELFDFTHPVSRALPVDWRPSDYGWTRFGVVVADFDACVSALERRGVAPLAPVAVTGGLRRVAIRDPHVGVVIEVMEAGAQGSDGPAVVYVANVVADLESARRLYAEQLEFELLPLDRLHAPSDEALWGLAGAQRDGFLVQTEDMLLEVVCYRTPTGRPKRADHRLCDQGIMNIAFGARSPEAVAHALARLRAAGHVPPYVLERDGTASAYVTTPEGDFEFGSAPDAQDAFFGFQAAPVDFIGKLLAS